MAEIPLASLTEETTLDGDSILYIVPDPGSPLGRKASVESLMTSVPDGTAVAPGLSFAAEDTIGMYRPSAGILGLAGAWMQMDVGAGLRIENSISAVARDLLDVVSDTGEGLRVDGTSGNVGIGQAPNATYALAVNSIILDSGNGNINTYGSTLQAIGWQHVWFRHVTSVSADGIFKFYGTGKLTASSGNQAFVLATPDVNQSGTAGYTALRVNVTETATGSGTNYLMDLQVGSASKFSVASSGRTGIGAAPNTNCLLYMKESSGAGAVPSTGDVLTIERSGGAFVNLITGTVNQSGVLFSDSSRARGSLIYQHTSPSSSCYMRFIVESVFIARLAENGLRVESAVSAAPRSLLDVVSATGEGLRVDGTSGHVGIGGEPDVSHALHVDNGSISSGTVQVTYGEGMLSFFSQRTGMPTGGELGSVYVTDDDGGAFPFTSVGNLVIQSRQSASEGAARAIVFVTRDTVRGVFSGISGNFGVGTDSPTEKLHVVGNGIITGTLDVQGGFADEIQVSGSATDGPIVTVNCTDSTVFGDDELGRIRWFMNDANPGGTCEVANIAAIAVDQTGPGQPIQGSAGEGSALIFRTGLCPTTTQVQTLAERLRITKDGEVGIGTDAPGALLHVRESDASGAAANANDVLVLERAGSTFLNFISGATNDQGLVFSDGTRAIGSIVYGHLLNSLAWTVGSTYIMGATNSGVRIETAISGVPSGLFHVEASVGSALIIDDTSGKSVFGAYGVGIGTTPTEIFECLGSGNIATVFATSSATGYISMRFRENTSTQVGWFGWHPTDNCLKFNSLQAGSTTSELDHFCVKDGDVGIGTPTPSEQLHNTGKTRSDGVFNHNGTDGATGSFDPASVTNITVSGGLITGWS